MRKTKAVEKIRDLFDQRNDAMSVIDLVSHFSEVMNKVTVYRVLSRLEGEGILHSVVDKDGLTWYAKCHDCVRDEHDDHHPHFQCRQCSKMTCLPMTIAIPEIENHRVEKENILLIGQCEECQTAQ